MQSEEEIDLQTGIKILAFGSHGHGQKYQKKFATWLVDWQSLVLREVTNLP